MRYSVWNVGFTGDLSRSPDLKNAPCDKENFAINWSTYNQPGQLLLDIPVRIPISLSHGAFFSRVRKGRKVDVEAERKEREERESYRFGM
jgi:hypothetical protein